MTPKALIKQCLLYIFIFSVQNAYSQHPRSCKIGLTLSGGGAKGLAHIGILKAIDSAGLQIDYVTGTSMGAVIGSLYAAGYSGDSIYHIAKGIDWNALLLSKPPLNSFIMELKNEYGRYAVEVPVEKGKIKMPSGILEAEELWLKFAELYYPVYNIKNFSELPRPFKCIATNIVTGQAVVIDKGNLMNAVRASMAIPTVFTEVNYNDSIKLVDGGIIRNFPVTDVKEMGADIIIGSSVNPFTLPQAKDISSPMQILLNIAFFRDYEYSQKDVDLCNYLIIHPLPKYSAGSFNSSDSIIDIGLQTGREYYPFFKKMADSLKAIYGTPEIKSLPPSAAEVTIRHLVTDSLTYIDKSYLFRMLSLKEGGTYTIKELEAGMRRVYGTRYFSKVYYRLEPVSPGVSDLHLVTRELDPLTAKLALNYTSLTRIMLIANLTKRDMIGRQSVSAVTVGISENPRIRLDHTAIMGSTKLPLSSVTEIYAEQQEFLQFRDFKANGNYRQTSGYFDTRIQLAYKRKLSYGMGVRLQAVKIKSLSQTLLDFDGRNYYIQPYLRYEYNTHDKLFLPRKGTWILLEPSAVISQSQKLAFKTLGIPIGNLDSLGISNANFIKIKARLQHVIEFKKKNFITLQAETGINFNSGLLLFHDFVVGGMQPVMRNQITFAGLKDAAERTNSLAKAAVNWRYHIAGSVFISASANIMYYSFLREKYYSTSNKFLSGYSIGVGMDSPLGPVEFNFSWCDQAKAINNYLNVGFRFSREMF